jgi:hypothetical protein
LKRREVRRATSSRPKPISSGLAVFWQVNDPLEKLVGKLQEWVNGVHGLVAKII